MQWGSWGPVLTPTLPSCVEVGNCLVPLSLDVLAYKTNMASRWLVGLSERAHASTWQCPAWLLLLFAGGLGQMPRAGWCEVDSGLEGGRGD